MTQSEELKMTDIDTLRERTTLDRANDLILGVFYEGPVPVPPELYRRASIAAKAIIRIARMTDDEV
jgi:hypothetical protein